MEAKGMMMMELTVGSKTMATIFFIVEVEGSYSVILGCNWIHTCRSVPSTLHQFLIQWNSEEAEIVPADTSACVAMADVSADWHLGKVEYISGQDLSVYVFLSICKDGFIPISVRLASEGRLY
jgi:hypothetical protein